MRRELIWVPLILVLAAGWAWMAYTPQHVSAFGLSTRMGQEEVRARLGAPDDRSLVLRDGEFAYARLGLEIDFQFQGSRKRGVSDLYSPQIELDGRVTLRNGASALEIRRLLGTPQIDQMDFLRFRVGEDTLDVWLERVAQTAKGYHILWRPKLHAQP